MSAPVRLRTATPADEAAVHAVMEAAFDPAYGEGWTAPQTATLFVLPGVTVRVAEADGPTANPSATAAAPSVHGFAAARTVADESELLLIAVTPAARARGIGRLLLDDWLARAAAAGAGRAFLEMRADNPAIRLYQRAGATIIGRRPAYYRGGDGQRRDAVTMRLPLPPPD